MKTKHLLNIRSFLIALTGMTLFLSTITVSAQSNFYVDAVIGSDNAPNNGSQAAPFKTIRRAHTAMPQPGWGTIYVAPGIYTGSFTTTKSGISDTQRIRYVSTTKWGAKIVVPSPNTVKTGFDNRGHYVTIDGFDVDGTQSAGTLWTVGINVAGRRDSVINCRVANVYTSANGSSGGGAGILLDSWYGHNDMHAIGNVVANIGPKAPLTGGNFYQGIYQTATGSIKNNITYGVSGAGIHLWHNDHDIDIVNNTTFGNNTGIVWGGGDYVNGTGKPVWRGPASNINIHNNIVFDNRSYGLNESGQNSATHTIKNNIVFQNGTDFLLKVSTHQGTIAADPQFVNYVRTGGGDYHLKGTSPALNAGVATLAPFTDYDGVTRLGLPDIGAYELAGSCPYTAAPKAPKHLSAAGTSSSTIKLVWLGKTKKVKNKDEDEPNNVSSYLVERSLNDSTGFQLIANLSADLESFSDSGLTAGTAYYYRVSAINCFGSSDFSNRANGTPVCLLTSVPNAPLNTAATLGSSTQINLTWTDNSSDEDKWVVERSTNATMGFAEIASLAANTTAYNNTGLSGSTTYYYRVRAVNCFGPGSYSDIVSGTTPVMCSAPSVPNPPLNTAATAISALQINIAWRDNSGLETNWLVERSTSSGSGFTVIATLPPVPGFDTNTSYSDTGLSSGTTYYYRVRAVNCVGFSGYSAVVSASTISSFTGADLQTFSTTSIATNLVAGERSGRIVSLYPNPLSSVLNLKIAKDVVLNETTLKIVDWMGKEVKIVSLKSHETSIDRGQLQNGIYFYRVTNGGQSIDSGRLIVQ
jgi:hypothetical protein